MRKPINRLFPMNKGVLKVVAIIFTFGEMVFNQTLHSIFDTNPPQFEKPLESHSMDLRTLFPGDYFLLDAIHSINGWKLGNQEQILSSPLNFGGWKSIYDVATIKRKPKFCTLSQGIWTYSLTSGNEVGDPHLQELTFDSAENHTPLIYTAIQYQSSNFSTSLEFDQNDHSSESTLGTRSSYLPEHETPGWFGENIPLASTLRWQGAFHFNSHYLGLEFNTGTLWNLSQATGQYSPWRGMTGKIEWQHKYLGFLWEAKRYQSLKSSESDQYWNQQNATWRMGTLDPSEEAQQYWLDVGTHYYDISEGSTFRIQNSFWPFLKLHLQTRTPQPTLFYHQPLLEISITPNSWSGKGQYSVYSRLRKQRKGIQLNIYRNSNTLPHVWEKLKNDSLYSLKWNPYPQGSGLNIHTEYLQNLPWFSIQANFLAGIIFERNYFVLDSIYSNDNYYTRKVRQGLTNQPDHLIGIHGKVSSPPQFWFKLESAMWYRYMLIQSENPRLELEPSPFVWTSELSKSFRTGFSFSLSSSLVGEKKVRYWLPLDEEFRVKNHFENNLTLSQTFFNEALRLKYTALHLFGEDILEHPSGNPLRFRILISAEGQF